MVFVMIQKATFLLLGAIVVLSMYHWNIHRTILTTITPLASVASNKLTVSNNVKTRTDVFSLQQPTKQLDVDEDFFHPPSEYNRTRLIVYNVIPKCASTTAREHFKSISRTRNKYSVVVLPANQTRFAEILTNVTKSLQIPVLFAYHHRYVDFARYGLAVPPHIQLMREPVEQAISLYQYRMDLQKIKDIEWNKTIDECLVHLDLCPGLSTLLNETHLDHFCENCTYGTEGIVNQAKQNIVKHHSVVGVTEELGGFFEVLEYMHPRYFTGLAADFQKKTSKRQNMNVSKHRKAWSDWAKAHLLRGRKDDIEVYRFVRKRFYLHWEEAMKHARKSADPHHNQTKEMGV